jgi:cytochrome c553
MTKQRQGPRRAHVRATRAERPLWPHVGWIIAAAALLLAVLVLWTRSAAAQTARGEDTIKRVMALSPDAARGGELYAQRCATCHGPLGSGDPERVIPAIAGQLQGYVVKQLVDVAEGDRTITEMHRVLARADFVAPQTIRDVAAFVSTLKPIRSAEQGDGEALARGEQIYTAQCASCHGKDAQGMAAGWVPALRGQHYAYLIKVMRQAAVGHRYSVDIEVIERLEALMLPDLMAVADFLSRVTGPVGMKIPLQPNGLSNERPAPQRVP